MHVSNSGIDWCYGATAPAVVSAPYAVGCLDALVALGHGVPRYPDAQGCRDGSILVTLMLKWYERCAARQEWEQEVCVGVGVFDYATSRDRCPS
ncbi:hypothetical protein E2C01_048450 [Portunus trituberculatus]|uniref:Uncharacterized protein n=1 Tax=Portunus trituberculatus TaxID=210409 RepID=A0A5B7GA91_PORTR|nr:hypothetical protein [Portunus trituberculatus]